MTLALSKPTPCEELSLPFEPTRKLGILALALIWQCLDEDPLCPSRVILAKMAQRQAHVPVSLRHLNRLRVKWNRNRPKGRPRGDGGAEGPAARVRLTPHLPEVGVHLFVRWLEQQGSFTPLIRALQQAIEVYKRDHRDEDFALLHHREETLKRRLQALILPPCWESSI